jgi:hypothetical protein
VLSIAEAPRYGPAARAGGPGEVGQAMDKVKHRPFEERIALMRLRLLRLVPLGALLLVMGCTTKITVCPVPAILADTQSLTIFRPGTTPDLANELFTVSLINAESDCTYNTRQNIVSASLNLTFRATRAPSTERASYTVPYFVAVHEGAKIYTKRLYTLRFNFAPGAATTTIQQSPDSVQVVVANGKLPWNYQMMSGFQMTSAQIEYAKTRGRYVQ